MFDMQSNQMSFWKNVSMHWQTDSVVDDIYSNLVYFYNYASICQVTTCTDGHKKKKIKNI